MRFPLQVRAKSRTPREHWEYYRWVRFINGQDDWSFPERRYIGFRTRFFHTFMDCVPKFIWRRLPVRWQSAHLFGDIE